MEIPSSTRKPKKLKILLPLIALLLCAGLTAAAIFTMVYTNNTATAKTPDVRLVAGTDSTTSTVYPAASVNVASTYDYATVEFSLFPSATNTPQPATYYTNLLNITNYGTAGHTIKTITVTALSDQSNLGSITIYYYATQTDTPSTGTPIGSATLTSLSTAPVTVFSGSQAIAASGIQYIEIVGYADDEVEVDDTISFTVSIQWA